MSKEELQKDAESTYEALIRLINSGRTTSAAFVKLVQRLEYTNRERVKRGFIPPSLDDSQTITAAWL